MQAIDWNKLHDSWINQLLVFSIRPHYYLSSQFALISHSVHVLFTLRIHGVSFVTLLLCHLGIVNLGSVLFKIVAPFIGMLSHRSSDVRKNYTVYEC